MTSRHLKAAGLALLPTLIGVVAISLTPEDSALKVGGLLAAFPFGVIVWIVVMALEGVHGGSVATMIVAPLVVNYIGNFWLLDRWLKKRGSS